MLLQVSVESDCITPVSNILLRFTSSDAHLWVPNYIGFFPSFLATHWNQKGRLGNNQDLLPYFELEFKLDPSPFP